MIEFLVGIDGGGTGTRAVLADRDGAVRGRGEAGPSALMHGAATAWREIQRAAVGAFESAGLRAPNDWGRCALGAGLAGATHEPWRLAFTSANPGFARLAIDTDAFAMLLGAHAGRPGTIVAAGTGSVGEVLRPDGSRRSVGGWGFPSGDEGSGAWLGLRAMGVAQAAMDGRMPIGELARKVWDRCGHDREAVLAWCAKAGQFAYAQLAPAVFEAEAADPVAADLLDRAVAALEDMARVLDPASALPLAVSGSVARRLAPRLAPVWRSRCVEPTAEPDAGALTLIRWEVDGRPTVKT
jgi:glucosamine kinase